MDSIGMSCIKYILFFFNLLFSISGLALITVGIIIKNAYYNYSRFIDDKFYSPPWVLIIVGVAVFVVAFFGCCGAIRESNCMLIMFSLLLFVIVILEALVALSGYYLKNDIDLMLQTKMNETISDYGKNPEITKSWDILQLDVSNHPLVNMCNGTYY
ncbi:leukocyte surface antigen CD53-like isoform X2 [Diaphorina citri]|uniref:Leukocyte surface antigen CD53-like isoform X1 n=1 Tax=Diaphorina citri TaxID=121845 RepID=A0A1S4E9C0_DIACI|nr:leukocyte surface antigen CD53-like isoform X1 [Diaphorina citri]XP_008469974.1 leukocyte surface antigen CD53-like isoform X1 [Diaphorina citri]XP_008469975.1 leukocyte surface antigen CD53-like isoform X2 [Diaphorina citri]XP_017298753.1 leukocyte surface antigen CD53-like isoform X2 [Diaphorina citri]